MLWHQKAIQMTVRGFFRSRRIKLIPRAIKNNFPESQEKC